MAEGTYEIVQTGMGMRYQVLVKDDMGEVLLKSQYRELKPMCLNEIRLLRRAALKDSLYERLGDENGCWYNVRAKDAHVLGTSPVYKSEEEREGGIGRLKRVASEAELVDTTPQTEQGPRIHDVLRTLADEALARKGPYRVSEDRF